MQGWLLLETIAKLMNMQNNACIMYSGFHEAIGSLPFQISNFVTLCHYVNERMTLKDSSEINTV